MSQNDKRTFSSGSFRDNNAGKPRIDLISPHFLTRLGHWLAKGAEKYGERNWEKGQPRAVIIESLMRHAVAVLEGRTDEDHISAIAFGAMALAHFDAVGNPVEREVCGPECSCHREVVEQVLQEDAAHDPLAPSITIPMTNKSEAVLLTMGDKEEGGWIIGAVTIPFHELLYYVLNNGSTLLDICGRVDNVYGLADTEVIVSKALAVLEQDGLAQARQSFSGQIIYTVTEDGRNLLENLDNQ